MSSASFLTSELLSLSHLSHSIPKEQERNTDLTLAIFIFGDTSEAVSSGGSHERLSESDGISPTTTGQMSLLSSPKSKSSPGLLNGTRNGLVQLQHWKCEDYGTSQAADTGFPDLNTGFPDLKPQLSGREVRECRRRVNTLLTTGPRSQQQRGWMWHDFLLKLKSGLAGRVEGFCVCEPELLMSTLTPAHPFVPCDSLLPVCVHAKSLSHVQPFVTLWTPAHQAPLSMGFSRHEYWSGLPCLLPGDLPDPGIKPTCLMSPALAGGFFATSTTWEALYFLSQVQFQILLAFLPLTLPSHSFPSLHY